MGKGYWIARLDITNEAEYAEYRKLNAIAFAKYGGKFLTRGGPFEKVMGTARQHHVVLEFPNHEKALACAHSPEYAVAKQHLVKAAEVDLIVIAGYDGPQP
jgi:uncharacterized protein (DUF1330 family)